MKRWIKANWLYIAAVLAGAILTPYAVQMAARERGYSGAFGGEFLIIPLFILIVQLGYGIKDMFDEFKEVNVSNEYGRKAQAGEDIR